MFKKDREGKGFLFYISHLALWLLFLPYVALAFYLLYKMFFSLSEISFAAKTLWHIGYTLLLSMVSVFLACLLGIPVAVYMEEFSSGLLWKNTVRTCTLLLSRLPAVFIGLFILVFVRYFLKVEQSFFSSVLALTILSLPYIIMGCSATLRSIPDEYRDAALGLGASANQAFVYVILPRVASRFGWYAFSCLGRVIGETTALFIAVGGFREIQTVALDMLEGAVQTQYAYVLTVILLVVSILIGILGEIFVKAGEGK